MSEIASLPYGQFLGTTKVRREVNGFSLSRMAPQIPAEEMPMHMHEDASFVFVIRGVYLSSSMNAGAQCRGPALIFNPAGTKHRDRFQRLDGTFLAISVADDRLKRAQECVKLRERATCFQNAEVTGVAQRIARECLAWNDASPLLVEGFCLQLLASMAARPATSGKQPPPWLRHTREMLNDRFTEPLRIEDLAAEAAVHPVHFVRAFREHFRCTPGEYVRRRRIERAASLLVDSEEPIACVAALAGFADQSHFSKLFRKHLGASPAEYRREMRRK
jgi:AraC family transcriptional regulator